MRNEGKTHNCKTGTASNYQTGMKAFLIFLFVPVSCFAQAVLAIDGTDCDMHGTAKAGSRVYYENAYKNRYTAPQPADFDTRITLQDLLQSADPHAFSQSNAVRLTGYVLDIKRGGVESCNCKTKDPFFRDTHIELTPDATQTDGPYRIIVEVTPRLRAKMAARGVDWSTEGLRKTIKGRNVAITGWLFYDAEHENGSFANDPGDVTGARNWRATCWEVHPVTDIEVLPGRPAAVPKKPAAHTKRNAPLQEQQGNPNVRFFLAGLVVLILLLFVFSARSKK